MPDLVPVHGGLEVPVARTVPLSRRRQFLTEAAALPRIELSRADLSTIYRVADGTLSPLTGPMDEETWHHVLDHAALEFGFRRYATESGSAKNAFRRPARPCRSGGFGSRDRKHPRCHPAR